MKVPLYYLVLYIANPCLNVSLFALISFAYLGEAYFCPIHFVKFPNNVFFGISKSVL